MSQRAHRNRNKGSSGNNRKAAEEFLEKNRKKPGVHQTQSGLQFLVLDEGSGDSPSHDSRVIIHQRCMLQNGKVIEDTYKENEPDEAEMSDLIEGYQEGLLLMKKGSRYKLFVAPDLAWGKKGSGNKIPPNALLIFDVRLIDFW